MTKEGTIHSFFNDFMTSYASSEVPDNVQFPYLSYELSTGSFGDGDISITVNLWFYTDSEAVPNAKVRELSELIGLGGIVLTYDNGGLWLKRGSPFSQSLTDDTDRNIKRRYINIDAEYLGEN